MPVSHQGKEGGSTTSSSAAHHSEQMEGPGSDPLLGAVPLLPPAPPMHSWSEAQEPRTWIIVRDRRAFGVLTALVSRLPGLLFPKDIQAEGVGQTFFCYPAVTFSSASPGSLIGLLCYLQFISTVISN